MASAIFYILSLASGRKYYIDFFLSVFLVLLLVFHYCVVYSFKGGWVPTTISLFLQQGRPESQFTATKLTKNTHTNGTILTLYDEMLYEIYV